MSWEESFVERIGEVRERELKLFRRAAIIMSLFQVRYTPSSFRPHVSCDDAAAVDLTVPLLLFALCSSMPWPDDDASDTDCRVRHDSRAIRAAGQHHNCLYRLPGAISTHAAP